MLTSARSSFCISFLLCLRKNLRTWRIHSESFPLTRSMDSLNFLQTYTYTMMWPLSCLHARVTGATPLLLSLAPTSPGPLVTHHPPSSHSPRLDFLLVKALIIPVLCLWLPPLTDWSQHPRVSRDQVRSDTAAAAAPLSLSSLAAGAGGRAGSAPDSGDSLPVRARVTAAISVSRCLYLNFDLTQAQAAAHSRPGPLFISVCIASHLTPPPHSVI